MKSFFKYKRFVLVFLILSLSIHLFAQNNDTTSISSSITDKDTSNTNLTNSIPDSTFKNSTNVNVKTIKVDEGELEDNVIYKAEDSIIYDIPNKLVYLYGNASIKYQEMDMKAGYIEYNWEKSEVLAKATIDSFGNLKRIEFKDETGEYLANEAKFNFKTKKGQSKGIVMKQLEGYLHGMQVKVIDSNTMYIKGARYTTCDLDEPHFYVELNKAKVIKEKLIVGKPANIIIENVRTPLFLPFAMLPSIKTKGTGLLQPEFGDAGVRGFAFRNIGYFWNINDKMNLTVSADAYTLGSWELRADYNYKVLYKYAGRLGFNINQFRDGGSVNERFNKNRVKPPIRFAINWNFDIDPKRLINSSFNINVNIVSTKNYQVLNSKAPRNALESNFSSSIAYSKRWPNKPFSISISTNLNQNTQSKQISLQLPNINFTVSRINPFQRKVAATTRKWYENIGFSYSMSATNSISSVDSTFLMKQTLRNMQNSIRHSIPISANILLFKYINFNTNFNYTDDWNFSYINKLFFDTLIQYNAPYNRIDTFYNRLVDEKKYGFKSYRQFTFNFGISTQLYGLFPFKKGKLQAIRHRISPSLGFSFNPDFTKPAWKYMRTVQSDAAGNTLQYSIFGNSPPKKSGSISLNFNNTIEIKVYSKKDSINHSKKITLLDNLSFGIIYDMIQKRLNFNPITASTHISDKLNLSASINLNPYAIDSFGRETKDFYFKTNRRLLRFASATISLNGSVRSKKADNAENQQFNQTIFRQQGLTNQFFPQGVFDRNYYNFSIPWSINYQYSFNISKTKNGATKKDTTIIFQSLNFGLDVNITKKWKVNVSTGFDFSGKKPQISRTDIAIIRDLHCWQMEIKYTPFGFYQGYYLSIYVTSQQFSFLKIQKQKSQFNSGIFGSDGFSGNGLLNAASGGVIK